jgi:HPt (histidine-containing phosphotransfer) domain-containing protein
MVANGDSGFGVLDADALRSLIELVGDDREALAEIVDAFLEEAPQRLTELREGIASADATVVGRAAHTLKANGRTFGAERLAQLSEEIETAARGGDLSPASARIDDLDKAWQEVLPEVTALAASDGA